jgi:signal transduction histidine kinase
MPTRSYDPVYFLLVDDLDENLLALDALLRREGLVLLKAKSGPQALELLLNHDIALALVDVQMPEMSGFELAELMRGTERTRTVPIIFLTAGSADQQRRFRGYEAGAVDFLQKPIEADILKSKADVFFELHRRRQMVSRYAASLEEADRRKNEFLATLAHELRNPLAPIRNGLKILDQSPDPARAAEVRDMMDRQLSHMVHLIDDLLDISRISQGKIQLRPETVDLNQVIHAGIEISRPKIDEAEHALTVDLPEGAIAVEADATRIAQIVGNLLNNAAKYTPAGGGHIRLSAAVEDGSAVIRVSDNGIGIPPHMLQSVFELFTQVDSAEKHFKGGLGIGLALARHLVDMHGGSIVAESAGDGQGSTFTLRLPNAALKAEMPERAKPAPSPASAGDGAPMKILVVDDNVASAQTIAWMLEMMGHDIVQAHTGEAAIDMAHEFGPDAVLLDIGLPDISGYDVCRRLRETPRFADTLLIAQTGWGQKKDRDMAFAAGFDHHLVKPASADDLERALRSPRPDA